MLRFEAAEHLRVEGESYQGPDDPCPNIRAIP
jgi:hypothetical protein